MIHGLFPEEPGRVWALGLWLTGSSWQMPTIHALFKSVNSWSENPPSETSLTRWGSGLSSRHHGTRALQVPDTTFLSTSACPLSYLDLGDQTHQKLLTMGSEYTSQAFIPTCALLMTSSHLLHWPPTLHPQTQPRYHWSRKPSLTAPHWVLHSPSPCFQSQWVMFFEYLRYTQHPRLSRKYCK